MKTLLSNNKGIALVTSLMLTMITLGVVMAMFYILTQSIKTSAATKRYRNVTEATYGGGELMAFDIIGNAFKNMSSAVGMSNSLVSTYANVDLSVSVSNNCFRQKLSSPSANWIDCSSSQKSMDISTIKSSPDLSFLLRGASSGQNYKVYAKVVDTTSGNTDTSSSMLNAGDSGGLLSGSGSAYTKTGGGSTVSIQHIPFAYRIEVQGEKETSAIEKSNVTVLFAY